jgi:S1-C subfamily serine protease
MAEILASLSEALADVVESAGKSVVRIEGRRRQTASGIVWSADGMILTANHVVTRDENIQIGLPNGETVAGTLIGRDPSTDLAMLRVDQKDLTAPAWAGSEDYRVGNLVLALGRPGKSMQATMGVISAMGGSWNTGGGGAVDRYLQTDVVMYPGFSGGPLAAANGKLIGLNSSALLRGASVTLPYATLTRTAEALVTYGHIRRGYLGIGAQPARLPENLAEELGQEVGLLIASVESDSPAAKAGLVLGDTLVRLDGEPVRHIEELMSLLTGDRIDKKVAATIVRGGEVREVSIVIGARG